MFSSSLILAFGWWLGAYMQRMSRYQRRHLFWSSCGNAVKFKLNLINPWFHTFKLRTQKKDGQSGPIVNCAGCSWRFCTPRVLQIWRASYVWCRIRPVVSHRIHYKRLLPKIHEQRSHSSSFVSSLSSLLRLSRRTLFKSLALSSIFSSPEEVPRTFYRKVIEFSPLDSIERWTSL